MLSAEVKRIPSYYTVPAKPIKSIKGERIIPIETTRSTHPAVRV